MKNPLEVVLNGKVEFLKPKDLMPIRQAAKLAGIAPPILEMGRRLLEAQNEGGVFRLGDAQTKKYANEIEAEFVKGLRKVLKALGPGGLRVKALREEGRLVFWLATGPGKKKASP